MSYTFRPSKDEKVSETVLIALGGTTGTGKTESAMRIARGIVGENGKFCVIDTENRRALNKKDRYDFDHLDMKPPYSPDNFREAIDAAEKAGYGAIIVDSFSHEWMGEGGCSDMAEQALEKLSGGDAGKAVKLSALAWKDAKRSHKKLVYRILQCDTPIIFCLRAEPKIKFTKDEHGRTQVVDAGWQPIAEKMFYYDMLIYALLMPENPGVPVHLKKLEPVFESMFPVGQQITEECGKKIAKWAKSDSQASPNAPESHYVTGKVSSVLKNPKGLQTFYVVKIGDNSFNTLDEQIAKEAKTAKESGVEIYLEHDGKGMIELFKLAEE